MYNNSLDSNVTFCLAHVTMPNAKNSKFSLTMMKGDTFMTFSGNTLVFCDALLAFSLARTIKHLVGVV